VHDVDRPRLAFAPPSELAPDGPAADHDGADEQKEAELLQISRSKMYELVASGVVPSVRLGRSRRLPRVKLEDRLRHKSLGTEPYR
jgi:excisionase family DNA binding protein